MTIGTETQMRALIETVVSETPILDIHTHLYPEEFGPMLLWGIDEMLTYHYLVAETCRYVELASFWALSRREQADLVWQTLFLDHSPVSEACRGVLTVLQQLGLDTGSRDLNAYRRYFAQLTPAAYLDRIFTLANVKGVIMTNDPFDELERRVWERGFDPNPRFQAALRLDGLLNNWPTAVPLLRGWGYQVEDTLTVVTVAEVRGFLTDWITRMDARYLAVSLPPTFRMPEYSPRGALISEAVLPVCAEQRKALALMIGAKRRVNPELGAAGDGVGAADVGAVEYLCATYPQNKFLVTMLARENQYELCVAARKFRNLHPFGCWWFLNNPSLIGEMTRMRLELLGLNFTAQHSDARVLEHLVYKWEHSRTVITDVLTDKYNDLAATGWQVTEAEIRRDVQELFGGAFQRFLAG